MTCGIQSAGVDLDSLFLARVNTKIANVGWQASGVDISNRFETRGTSTARANTGLQSAGVDLAQLFRDINLPLGVSLPGTNGTTRNDGGTPAEFHMVNDGSMKVRNSSVLTAAGFWIGDGGATASLYQVGPTLISGTLSSGPASGTWSALSTTQTWTRGAAVGAIQTVVFDIRIRRASDSIVIAGPMRVTLTCDRP